MATFGPQGVNAPIAMFQISLDESIRTKYFQILNKVMIKRKRKCNLVQFSWQILTNLNFNPWLNCGPMAREIPPHGIYRTVSHTLKEKKFTFYKNGFKIGYLLINQAMLINLIVNVVWLLGKIALSRSSDSDLLMYIIFPEECLN